MSLEALPGKKAINQKESTLGLAGPCWSGGGGGVGGAAWRREAEGRVGLVKPQGEGSGVFQVHSQTGLGSQSPN